MQFSPLIDFVPSTEYPSRFNLTHEENLFLAKHLVVDSIWKSARLEGLDVTYAQTYAVYERASVSGLTVNDILTIINLKHGWEHILSTIEAPLTIDYLCHLQREVARDQALVTGALRSGHVGIRGTDYKPRISDRQTAEHELEYILSNSSPVDRALNLMLWCIKSQLFWDGNKRTAMLAANKILIQHGCGLLSVAERHLERFHALLSDYYTHNDPRPLKDFLYSCCIDGIVFNAPDSEPQPTL